MSELNLVKVQGVLVPADAGTQEKVNRMPGSSVLRGKFATARNSAFLRKYFALLNVGFELWEPGDISTKWGTPQKNFDQFREQVQVLAGFGEPVFNVDGTFRMRSKSISFANMEEDEFAVLFSKVIDVILQNVGAERYTEDDIRKLVDNVMEFA
jgi:hypothetical protein